MIEWYRFLEATRRSLAGDSERKRRRDWKRKEEKKRGNTVNVRGGE